MDVMFGQNKILLYSLKIRISFIKISFPSSAMKKLELFSMFTLLVLSILSFQTAFADASQSIIYEERGKDYKQTEYSDGRIIWTGGLPEYVTDSQGNYINAIVTEDVNYVYVDSSTPFKVDKNTCDLVVLEKARITDKPQERLKTHWNVQQADLGEQSSTQNWLDVLAPTADCTVTHWQNTTGTYVQAIQTDGINKLVTIYEKRTNAHLPESHHWFSYDSAELTNKKYGFVSVQQIPNTEKIVIDDDQFSLDDSSITKLNLINKTELWKDSGFLTHKEDMFQKLMLFKKPSSNDIMFDLTKAEPLLSDIHVSSENDKLKIETKYLATVKSLLPNEQLYLDPTFGYVTNDDGYFGISSSCGGTVVQRTEGATGNYYGPRGPGSAVTCYRSWVSWDTSSIPDDANVSDVVFKFAVFYVDASSAAGRIHSLENNPSTTSDGTLNADIRDGTMYISSDTKLGTLGDNQQIDLGSSADSRLDSDLASGINWFGIGISETTETSPGSNYDMLAIDSKEATDGNPKPTLQVTYTTSGSGSNQTTTTSSSREISAITIPVDDVTLSPNQSMVVLDTTGVGTLELISVTANLPCTSSAPNLKILGGIFGNTTNIINTSADYTGYDGPNFTCIFRDMKNSTAQGITINTIMLTNDGISNVSIPKGVIVTLTGMFK